MQHPQEQQPPFHTTSIQPPARRSYAFWWLTLFGGLSLVMLCCCGMFGSLAYVGGKMPDTSIYEGHEVPEEFIATMKETGALEDDEALLFFYSPAMFDIRQHFCFQSHRRLVVYRREGDKVQMQEVLNRDIESVELFRPASSLEESQITLHLKNGEEFVFEVSSEEHLDEVWTSSIRRIIFLEGLKPEARGAAPVDTARQR